MTHKLRRGFKYSQDVCLGCILLRLKDPNKRKFWSLTSPSLKDEAAKSGWLTCLLYWSGLQSPRCWQQWVWGARCSPEVHRCWTWVWLPAGCAGWAHLQTWCWTACPSEWTYPNPSHLHNKQKIHQVTIFILQLHHSNHIKRTSSSLLTGQLLLFH